MTPTASVCSAHVADREGIITMSMNNHVMLIGNLVDDVTLRYTSQGVPVANGRIAVNDRINVNGEWRNRTTYVNIVAWRQLGENLAMSAGKGDRIAVTGRLAIREYTAEGGQRTWYTEVQCDDVSVTLKFAVVGELEQTNGRSVAAVPDVEPDDSHDDEPVAA